MAQLPILRLDDVLKVGGYFEKRWMTLYGAPRITEDTAEAAAVFGLDYTTAAPKAHEAAEKMNKQPSRESASTYRGRVMISVRKESADGGLMGYGRKMQKVYRKKAVKLSRGVVPETAFVVRAVAHRAIAHAGFASNYELVLAIGPYEKASRSKPADAKTGVIDFGDEELLVKAKHLPDAGSMLPDVALYLQYGKKRQNRVCFARFDAAKLLADKMCGRLGAPAWKPLGVDRVVALSAFSAGIGSGIGGAPSEAELDRLAEGHGAHALVTLGLARDDEFERLRRDALAAEESRKHRALRPPSKGALGELEAAATDEADRRVSAALAQHAAPEAVHRVNVYLFLGQRLPLSGHGELHVSLAGQEVHAIDIEGAHPEVCVNAYSCTQIGYNSPVFIQSAKSEDGISHLRSPIRRATN